MNRVRFALLGFLLVASCKDKSAATAAAAPEAGSAAPDGEWTLTLAKLDGYLAYQRALLVQAGKVAPPAWDGGLKPFTEPTVADRATFDERSRLEAGLTAEDVERIETMVAELASHRMAVELTGDQPVPAPPPAMDGSTRPEVDPLVAAALKEREQMIQASKTLAVERERYGDAAIDLLLQRERELLKNWRLMMGLSQLDQPN